MGVVEEMDRAMTAVLTTKQDTVQIHLCQSKLIVCFFWL